MLTAICVYLLGEREGDSGGDRDDGRDAVSTFMSDGGREAEALRAYGDSEHDKGVILRDTTCPFFFVSVAAIPPRGVVIMKRVCCIERICVHYLRKKTIPSENGRY